MCVFVSIYVFERVQREMGARNRRQKAESWQSPGAPPLRHALTPHPDPLRQALPPLFASFRPASSPGPALSRKPLYCSLLILPKHIILFALHVLKVKVAPGHTFVDVFDVIAGGLEVSGGVVGP